MAKTRCTSAGCSRFAVHGHLVCSRHMQTPGLIQPQPHRYGKDTGDPGDYYRARLAQAESYRDLLGPKLSRLMREAAEEQNLTDEIGMLRIVMARVMDEEHDPVRLANAVARLTNVAVMAMRTQRALSGELTDSLTDALTQILLELDASESGR